MSTKASPTTAATTQRIVDAIERTMPVIEFTPDGIIVRANDHFLGAVGYSLEEIRGKHHSLFMKAADAATPEYKEFWTSLAAGTAHSGRFERLAKDGSTVWLEASYTPVTDEKGNVVSVIKFAHDITQARKATLADMAKLAAIDRSMAAIEFEPDGTILHANALFLAAGTAHSGRFERVAKDGSTVWLEASYTPVTDEKGTVVSVIKFAHDITQARRATLADMAKLAAIDRSMAAIEFEPDGTILHANALFLAAVGYTESEVKGRHHRIFLTPEEAQSAEYASFWKELAAGQLKTGRFQRIGQGGRSIWLEASYNPIFDLEGRVTRVVKFATDITEKVESARLTEIALDKAREAERIREELDRTLQEMSTPVMPIWDSILLLPLVGVVDSARTDDVMRKSLERISETRSKVFILDISGVPAVDTAVANQLLKITKATLLMGCETIISGLSPAIARTMVDLGVDVGEVRTTATLRDAFAISLRKVGGQTAGMAAA